MDASNNAGGRTLEEQLLCDYFLRKFATRICKFLGERDEIANLSAERRAVVFEAVAKELRSAVKVLRGGGVRR